MRLLSALLAITAYAGCYQPSVGDCQYTCSAGNTCPSGFECRAGACRLPGAAGTCDSGDAHVPDGEPDAPNLDAPNIDASSLDASTVDAATDAAADAAVDAAPPLAWSIVGSGDAHEYARGHSLRLDSTGDIVIAGRTGSNTLAFAGTSLGPNLGSFDGFVVKLSPTGQHRWSRRLGGASTDVANAVAIGPADSVLVVGSYAGATSLGGNALPVTGGLEAFVVKLDAQGQHVWSTGFATSLDDEALGVAVDPSGDVYVTGSIDWQPFSPNGEGDIFLHKLDGATGAIRWSKAFTSVGGDIGFDVTTDAAGDVYLAGSFANRGVSGGSLDLGGTQLTSTMFRKGFVAKLDGDDGAHLWSQTIENSSHSDLYAIAVSSTAVFLGGASRGNATIAGGPAVPVRGEYDFFLARLATTNGAHVWSKALGGASYDICYDLNVDASGDLLAAGQIASAGITFGGPTLPFTSSPADVVLARFTAATGAHLASRAYGGSGDDIAYGAAIDPTSGNVHLAGHASAAIDFGAGSVSDSLGGYGFFVTNVGAVN